MFIPTVHQLMVLYIIGGLDIWDPLIKGIVT